MTDAPGHAAGLTSRQRAVLDVLRDSDDHPTAVQILGRARARSPRIGAATIYRALARLVATGDVQEIAIDGAVSSRYEASQVAHDHLVCMDCGQVVDVRVPLRSHALESLATASGYTLSQHEVRVRGRCSQCAAEERVAGRSKPEPG